MINVNKEAKTLAEAVGITEEQFNAFGNKMVDSINEFANTILEKGTEKEEKKVGISRIDFLERLSSLNQEELLLLALTTFENHIQQAISLKVQDRELSAKAEEILAEQASANDVIEDAVIVEDTIAEELPKETPEV